MPISQNALERDNNFFSFYKTVYHLKNRTSCILSPTQPDFRYFTDNFNDFFAAEY